MTHKTGDPGHIKDHNDMREAVLVEAAKFGVTLPHLAGPFVGNEPNHIGVHNQLATAMRTIATAGGIDIDANFALVGITFPDTATLGDPGHTYDHNALAEAISLIQLSPAFNDATGGTITTVNNYNGTGQTWRVHTFSGGVSGLTSTLHISKAAQPFRLLIVGGGGGGGGAQGQGGQGGRWVHHNIADNLRIAAGDYTVNVGAAGLVNGGNGGVQSGGGGSPAPGSLSRIQSVATAQGGAAAGNVGVNGQAGISTNIRGTAETFGGGGGKGSYQHHSALGVGVDGGGDGASWNGGHANQAGKDARGGGGGGGGQDAGGTATGARGGSGIVVLAYQIG